MSRKRAVVEIGVTGWLCALALAGSAWAQDHRPDEPPEGVDYLMAMQCAALNLAMDDVSDGSPHWSNRRYGDQYMAWARVRASGSDSLAADRDVEVSRRELVALAGDGAPAERRHRLAMAHQGELRACEAMVRDPDRITITLGG